MVGIRAEIRKPPRESVFIGLAGGAEGVGFGFENAGEARGGLVEHADELAGRSLKKAEELGTEDILARKLGEFVDLSGAQCRVVEHPGANQMSI